MCVVSMIDNHYMDRWRPYTLPQPWYPYPYNLPNPNPQPVPTQEEMQKQLEEFMKLRERAKEYDKKNNEPECELDEKRKVLLDMAKQLGVEINFGPQ